MTYVAIEGIDGAGKSTVADAAVAELLARGVDAVGVREPGGTRAGEAIRQVVLLDEDNGLGPWAEAMLFAAARSQLAAEVIGPALDAGRTVIGDRSVYSSLAYQGGGRGLGIERVRTVNEAGLGGVWPERVVLLKLDPAAGLAREDLADRISAEGLAFQEDVAAAYDRLAEAEPDRFVIVEAARPLDEVVAATVEAALA